MINFMPQPPYPCARSPGTRLGRPQSRSEWCEERNIFAFARKRTALLRSSIPTTLCRLLWCVVSQIKLSVWKCQHLWFYVNTSQDSGRLSWAVSILDSYRYAESHVLTARHQNGRMAYLRFLLFTSSTQIMAYSLILLPPFPLTFFLMHLFK